jgi:hypothetical protein
MNLNGLTKEKKIELLDAIREKKRRLKRSRPPYLANSGQMRVHSCTKPFRFVFAGNGSGKTALGANEAKWAADGYNPVLDLHTQAPARVIIVLDHPDKVKDVWLPELRKWMDIPEDWCHKNGKPYINDIRFPNGSYFKFMFHEQPELAFEGLEVDVVILDEPPPRHIWIALRRGGRTKGRKARYLLIGTPIKCAWLRIEVYDRWMKGELDDHECFVYGSDVNKENVDKNWYNSFFSALSEKERKIRQEGLFFDLDGLALSHLFKKQTHVIPKHAFKAQWDLKSNPVVVTIDPHPEKKHVASMVGADKFGYLYYIKETSEKLVAREFARHLLKWFQGIFISDIVCDSLGSTDGTGNEGFHSFIQVLNDEFRKQYEQGNKPRLFRVRATTFDEKSDTGLIERFRDLLALPEKPNSFGQYIPKLRIVEGCDGIIKDIENVSFYKYKDIDTQKEKLDLRQTDFLSCLKYGLAVGVHFNKGKEKVYKQSRNLYGF